ncbi:hypothetical protein [Pelagicoccus sp. SDUM812002]|uniref:hypothetical protein n=1 Tax=Pelagicoccus sp. SDUM812002 TaxID=3041266 RepID=UPI00280E3C3D|nr:hypothetical protein [Pelagicoccus sp. SDUM812002]MDQ8187690.1 hypothetical protein [Pelagicoccus sp. SDUM812002]
MTLSELLQRSSEICILHDSIEVENTAAALIKESVPDATVLQNGSGANNGITIGVLSPEEAKSRNVDSQGKEQWMYIRANEKTGIELYASHTWFIYRLAYQLIHDFGDRLVSDLEAGEVRQATFKNLRTSYDSLLNNHARTAKDFDPEDHIREMAQMGFTHVEVNGLATTFPAEENAPGELLYLFYTYCAALDQFVYSKLNKGIYPYHYLQANLNKLVRSAKLAEKYGLRAGLVCFEPRSVSDKLLERYPMLRGARVDHPLRSFRPRYNLCTSHPVVLDHYQEMLEKIMRAAPNIDFMSIWSNDSGAGFEYTASLYVGRNGGGYEIREWKDENEIVEAAANNILRFMKTLRTAGRKVNPDFRCILKNEVFYAEQDHLRANLEPGLEFETSTLDTKGFEGGYQHPKYEWADDFMFTGLFNQFHEKERKHMDAIEAKGSNVHVYINSGAFWNLEPIKAVPYPKLMWEKLRDLRTQGVDYVANMTGTIPESLASYNINQEVLRAFQADPDLPLETVLKRAAVRWIGEEDADLLVRAWLLVDEAYRSYPPPVSVLSFWSTWYRILVRPFVPNFEALTEEERAFYEDFHLGHANNRVRVDFRREVNFDFCTPEYGNKCRHAISDNVFPAIEQAIELARNARNRSPEGSERQKAWTTLLERFIPMKNWFRTQRNVAAWVEGVHGYMEATDDKAKADFRELTKLTVLDEKANAAALLEHVRTATTDWMIESAVGETTFIYGSNLEELLEKKIALMEGREEDEPFVDPDYMWRVPGINC